MPTLEQCKENPALLDQRTGCCGFAGALMALLARKSTIFDDIVECFILGSKFKDIEKSVRMGDRIMRRLDSGIIPDETREDFAMCLGLMVLFKEYSKQNGLDAWEKCITYSRSWKWEYANMSSKGPQPQKFDKLKDLPSDAVLGKDFEMAGLSYKKGDLACPDDVMPTLLGLVDISVQTQDELIDTSGFEALLGKSSGLVKPNFRTFNTLMHQTQTTGSASANDFDGVIMGVGNRKGFDAFHNVTHWIYVPTKPNNAPSSGDFKVWTWGNEHDFYNYIVDVKKYYPAYAIYLAK